MGADMRVASAVLILTGIFGLSEALSAPEPASSVPPVQTTVEAEKARDEACKRTACRPAKLVVIRVNKEKTVGLGLQPSPYVDETGAIHAWPGERLVFHVEMDGGALSRPVFVREEKLEVGDASTLTAAETARLSASDPNTPAIEQSLADMKINGLMRDRISKEPAGTLIVDYRQIPGGGAMILETGHNFPQALKFDAFINYPSGRHEHSSTCGVLPNLLGLETWGGPLMELTLSNFRLVESQKDSNGRTTMTCD